MRILLDKTSRNPDYCRAAPTFEGPRNSLRQPPRRIYLVELNHVRQRIVSDLVGPEEAVTAGGRVDEEVLEASQSFVGDGIAPDFLTDTDQEGSGFLILHNLLRFLSADNP